MELVYMWVEKYKNIEKQGFNFSPKFRCEYNPETTELKIEENPNYLSIFPDNINITAIVGKNGSGKSNLLHLVIGGIYNNTNNWREIVNLILVFKKSSEFIVYNFYTKNEIRVEVDEVYTYIIKNNINNEVKSLYFLLLDFSLPQQNIWNDSKNYKKYYAIEPSRFYKTTGGGSITSKIEPSSFDSNLKSNIIYFYWYINKYSLEKILDIFKLPKFNKLICYGKTRIGNKVKEETFNYLKNKQISILNYDFSNLSDFQNIECSQSEYKLEDLREADLNYLEYLITFLNIEMKSEDEKYFWNLSTGQKILLSYFGLLLKYFVSKKDEFDFSIVLIDEVEVYLHPEWQKNFIYYLILFIKEFKLNDFYTQFIIATHSPFIISDLPKENIIFLDKDENGKCKVVDGLNEKKETFGANIHTLLSDSFFMEDGLMGEFAKSKIDEIINFHNKIEEKYIKNKSLENEIKFYEENKDKLWNIQRITGEEYLKQIIKNHLIEIEKLLFGKDRAKEEEIKRLQKEIERLKSND